MRIRAKVVKVVGILGCLLSDPDLRRVLGSLSRSLLHLGIGVLNRMDQRVLCGDLEIFSVFEVRSHPLLRLTFEGFSLNTLFLLLSGLKPSVGKIMFQVLWRVKLPCTRRPSKLVFDCLSTPLLPISLSSLEFF